MPTPSKKKSHTLPRYIIFKSYKQIIKKKILKEANETLYIKEKFKKHSPKTSNLNFERRQWSVISVNSEKVGDCEAIIQNSISNRKRLKIRMGEYISCKKKT